MLIVGYFFSVFFFYFLFFFFFFSSRRRHTRCYRDWSSDVCSSDLVKALGDFTRRIGEIAPGTRVLAEGPFGVFTADARRRHEVLLVAGGIGITPIRALMEDMERSEERRVGKEWRSRWTA